jgi:hypothetical protein
LEWYFWRITLTNSHFWLLHFRTNSFDAAKATQTEFLLKKMSPPLFLSRKSCILIIFIIYLFMHSAFNVRLCPFKDCLSGPVSGAERYEIELYVATGPHTVQDQNSPSSSGVKPQTTFRAVNQPLAVVWSNLKGPMPVSTHLTLLTSMKSPPALQTSAIKCPTCYYNT